VGTVAAGATATLALAAGDVLSVVAAAGGYGNVGRSTDGQPRVSTVVSVGAAATLGPYDTEQRFEVHCQAGSLSYGVATFAQVTADPAEINLLDGVTATTAELNDLDLSARTQAIAAAGAIDLDARHVKITGPASGTYTVTLAAPTRASIVKVVEMVATTGTNAVTLALTNVVGGSAGSSASFNAVGETLVLVSANGAWVVLAEVGVTLS
jgi:hypothetical protein